jgi:predicted enzyme related to lactoylglutathione lyase
MIVESYIRVFVGAGELDKTSAFYRALLSGEETQRFDYPEAGLKLATVSSPKLSVLIIAGDADKRRRFELTRLTIKVTGLAETIANLLKAGAEQLEPIQKTPVGQKTRFRHPDGLVVEYVEHDAR